MSEDKRTKTEESARNKSKSYKEYYSIKKMGALRFEYENKKNPPLKKFWNSLRRNFELPFVKSTLMFNLAFIFASCAPLGRALSDSVLLNVLLTIAGPFFIIYAGYFAFRDQRVIIPLYMNYAQRGDGHTPLAKALVSNELAWIEEASSSEFREGRNISYSLLMDLLRTWEITMSLDPEEGTELRKQLLEIAENLSENDEKSRMLQDWMRVVRMNALDKTGEYIGMNTDFANRIYDPLLGQRDEEED